MPLTVYVVQSVSQPAQHYVGLSSNLQRRLVAHNAGESNHTAKFRPWQLIVSIEFRDADRSRAFEKYLKSGSGRAFMARHFLA